MDKRVLRERMRRKKRQMLIRRYTRLATYLAALILLVVFVVRGVIMPIANRISGGGKQKNDTTTEEVMAEPAAADPNAAVRQPLKDAGKVASYTPGWHEGDAGKWYQNADGTYYAGGFQEIDGVTYSFDEDGYIQTGWVTKGVNDYYFNEDGSYNPDEKRPMLALTYDDGPGEFTDKLLDCLEENNAHATFFMLGENVPKYPDAPKRMLEIGCEIGTHSYDHPNLYNVSSEEVASQFERTDNALIEACGQAATVARAPFGNWSEDIINTVGKPFFMWSLDSLDWQYKDVNLDYQEIMEKGDLSDGTIILMHDIHEASVETSLKIIPELIEKGYKLVTVSEMAEAKGVDLQLASYSDFWQSSLDNGTVAGYNGTGADPLGDSGDGTEESEDAGSEEDGSYSEDGEESYDDGESYSEDDSYSEE